MKKGQTKKSDPPPAALGRPAAGEAIHFRLCHICFHLNESSSEIIRCQSCRKYLSVEPIWEYLEGRQKARQKRRVQDDDDEDEDEETETFTKRIPPILTGLSVLW